MKKEYMILVAVIVCLSAYLFFHNEGQDNYKLPEIEKIDTAKVSSLVIEKQDRSVSLMRQKDFWSVTDNDYPADASMVDVLLDNLKMFKLTTLISQKSDLKRYHLDDDNRIKVIVFKKGKPDFTFSIGKEAPTGNHTFVMIDEDKNIYHAKGSFALDFDQDADAFRDRKFFEVKAEAVKRLNVVKNKLSRTVISKEDKNTKGEAQTSWQLSDGKPADKQKIDSFIASVSYLKCDLYPESISKKDVEKVKPICTIEIETQEKIFLNLYKFSDSTKTYGISSMNDYVFALSDFDAKEIIKSIDTFLGIEVKEK